MRKSLQPLWRVKMPPKMEFLTLSINQAEIIRDCIEKALETIQKQLSMGKNIETIIIPYPIDEDEKS